MEVDCNNCKEPFEIALQEKKHGKWKKKIFFSCPHCKNKYQVATVPDK